MDISKFSPLNERVLLKVETEIEKKKGGLFIPEASQEKSTTAEVIAVYDGCKIPLGTKVMFSKYSGTTIEKDGAEYKLVLEKDLLGKFE
jgi:chaperonin GroES